MVIYGYNPVTDEVFIADPGSTLWPRASNYFRHPSLKNLVNNYMQARTCDEDNLENIGVIFVE